MARSEASAPSYARHYIFQRERQCSSKNNLGQTLASTSTSMKSRVSRRKQRLASREEREGDEEGNEEQSGFEGRDAATAGSTCRHPFRLHSRAPANLMIRSIDQEPVFPFNGRTYTGICFLSDFVSRFESTFLTQLTSLDGSAFITFQA